MSAPASTRARALGACAALVAAVLLAFRPALAADFQVAFDDDYNITANTAYRGLSPAHLWWMATSFHLGHWQPLSWLSLAADHALWGMDARGYHLTNVLLHALNAVLVFVLCRALLRAAGAASAHQVWPAFVAALLFAVHPLRVESVAWVTERRDVLSTAFLLPAVLAWLRWCADGRARWYALALVFYVLSLLSKAWGITLPAILLLLDVWPLRRWQWARLGYLLAEKLPFIAAAAGAATLAFLAQRASGAMHYAAHFTPLQKAAQACYGLPFYIQKTVWPSRLLPAYLLDLDLDPSDGRFLLGFAITAAGVAAALLARKRFPAVTAALFAYAILVSPVLGLTQSGVQLVADRYTYLATLPFALLAGGALGAIAAPGPRRAAALAALLAAAVLGRQTHTYACAWHDSWTLWRYTLARDPENSLAYNQLGTLYADAGDPAKATEMFELAVSHDPLSYLAFENRGKMRYQAGDRTGALADWERAIALNGRRSVPFVNRGAIKYDAGDYPGARGDYETAVGLQDDDVLAWFMLARTCAKLGDGACARAAVERCLELAPAESALRQRVLEFQAELP